MSIRIYHEETALEGEPLEPRVTFTSLIRSPGYYRHFFVQAKRYTFSYKKTLSMRSPPLIWPMTNGHICTILQSSIAKISMTSPIVINMPTRERLAGETNSSFV